VKLVATPDAAGTALIEVRFEDRLKTLAVIVGQPATGEAPVMASPTIGIEIKE
jgi:hypothetical protein